ncbi:hypothetical protein AYO47_00260 [Planctomyces sp. SCGC AG-212-M04]|nr:hypothetical protein AYO47_00260 [Planctomyces sp. SCGC AG-212-M04]
MTSPPSPPNRRRRRIVIAVAVLAIVSTVIWWFWPRGDARFVGTWYWTSSGGDFLEVMTFYRDGTCVRARGGDDVQLNLSYRVRNDSLVLSPAAWDEFQFGWQSDGLWDGLQRLGTAVWQPTEETYRFWMTSHDEIRLSSVPEGLVPIVSLTRIPE